MMEPLLTDDDRRLWAKWKRICLLHARTAGHKRRVEQARGHIRTMFDQCPDAYVAWSAGKDSTAMTHLVAELIPGVRAMSIKDDCDYPGEVEYIERLANEWDVKLTIVRPSFSLQDALRDGQAEAGDDIHSRASEFADEGFYSLIEEYRHRLGLPGVYLGLRKDESHARLMNRAKRGAVYTKRDGETVCMPLCDWSDRDVYAYLFTRDIELLPVYRCIRLHDSPGRVRKSWWIPGKNIDHHSIWLKTYYPSLHQRMCELMPGASRFA